MSRITLVLALVLLAHSPGARAGEEALEKRLSELAARIEAQESRIRALEQSLQITAAAAGQAQNALARELSQPMLLLVGMGPCPAGFKRIGTKVWLLTRARTLENGHLFDAAGLTYEDPPGVGNNVYRDMDLCFRAANTVKVE